MVLTSSYRRRTAGFTALFAALLLTLTGLFAVSPAAATDLPAGPYPVEVAGNPDCELYGLTELTRFDPFTGETGEVLAQDGVTITITDHKVEDGKDEVLAFTWTSDSLVSAVLVKAGSSANVYGYDPATMSGSAITVGSHGVSHVTFCEGEPSEVTPEKPDFTDPDCDTEAAVDLPETEGVDYGIEGDITPGGTVTVTATPQAGYKFPDDAQTVWEHTFAEVPEDCDEPVEVTTDEPTFTDPTCDMNEVGLDVPETTGVVYTVTGDQEPGGTVTVTAAAAEGYVLAEDAETEWQHTYGPLATDCGGVGGSETDPAASVLVNCAVAQITLDNTGSDVAVTYTITGVAGYDAVEVPAGEQQTIDDLGIAEDADYDITVSANGMDDATAAGNYNCVTPTTDVSPDVVEKPAPDPAPTAQPAAQPAAQELPATGLGSTELLLLALLMLGLGTAALLGSDPRRQI